MNKEIAGAQGTQTKCVHAPREFNSTSAISPPIWQTNAFLSESSEHFAALAKSVSPSEYYSRYGNPTLGGFETLLVRPAAMWGDTLTDAQRSAMGVGESLVRISVGLEDERDLIEDFSQALERV